LKARLTAIFGGLREALVGVPGFPDATLAQRLARVAPLAIPGVLLWALAAAKCAAVDPLRERERAAFLPLCALEADITAKRMACSDEQSKDLQVRRAHMEQLLPEAPLGIAPLLNRFRQEAAEAHWTASFQVLEGVTPGEGAPFEQVLVRGRFVPESGNDRAWPALFPLFERLSEDGPQIGLTRIAIRADEHGRYAVESLLAITCRAPHEKAAQ